MTPRALILFCFVVAAGTGHAQMAPVFTHADTLRGSVGPGRAWWNVLRYDLWVKPDFASRTIEGVSRIGFAADNGDAHTMQIDLQEPLAIDSIVFDADFPAPGSHVTLPGGDLQRDSNCYFFPIHTGRTRNTIAIYYHGSPHVAVKPPWDGGWIFRLDDQGRPWMSVACEGVGASIWYPCKDYLGDEPDSGASLAIVAPDSLAAVGNGKLKEKKSNGDGTTTWTWAVKNPINNYNIIPYIGNYRSWHRTYAGEKGALDVDGWFLAQHLSAARTHLDAGIDSMLRCFEYWFGPYPFYEDGYKLVQSPHLGMEHQSAVAYGNGFKQGYAGKDLSGSGYGLLWDFILVHESGHEWFGNNITARDIADEWIHESFTNYSETIYTGYYFGKKAADAYVRGTRANITNKTPIIFAYGVNAQPEGTDEYYKGGNMLHTIRAIIGNDSLFRRILRGLNKTFYHQTVTARQIEDYISRTAGIDLAPVFAQYLTQTAVPVLAWKQTGYTVKYRWENCLPGFRMPVRATFGAPILLRATTAWKSISAYPEGKKTFSVDPNFYIGTREEK